MYGDQPVLMDVNTRPAGGLHQLAQCGVNAPWAAVQLALGEETGEIVPPFLAQDYTVVSGPRPVRPVSLPQQRTAGDAAVPMLPAVPAQPTDSPSGPHGTVAANATGSTASAPHGPGERLGVGDRCAGWKRRHGSGLGRGREVAPARRRLARSGAAPVNVYPAGPSAGSGAGGAVASRHER